MESQRSFATARFIEYDAVVLSCSPAPAPDASAPIPSAGAATIDPRVTVLVAEAFRHAKPIGGWSKASEALVAASCDPSAAGVLLADDPAHMLSTITTFMARHRVWDRLSTATLPG